jgi:hypothetical protein
LSHVSGSVLQLLLAVAEIVRRSLLKWTQNAPSGNEMTDTLTPLILDMLAWIAAGPRTYSEVMEAWRTSCPRLTVWEEANERGYLAQRSATSREMLVELAPQGRDFLEAHGRAQVDRRQS